MTNGMAGTIRERSVPTPAKPKAGTGGMAQKVHKLALLTALIGILLEWEEREEAERKAACLLWPPSQGRQDKCGGEWTLVP